MTSCETWPIVWPCDDPGGSPEQKDAAVNAAQTILWSRTGRRLGLCTAHDRYRAPGRFDTRGRPYMTDDLVWHNGGHSGAQSCAIDLTSTPVRSITEVLVWGDVVDPSTYRLERNALVRAGTCWPVSTVDQPPAIEVTYVFGIPLTPPVFADPDADPPVEGVDPAPLWGLAAAAMGEVAYELVKGMCGEACRLPQNIATVTRMGATITRPSPQDTATSGLLGLEIADQLIMATNPGRLRHRSRVYSPDMAQRA